MELVKISIVLTLFFIYFIYETTPEKRSLEAIPERVVVNYVNGKYLENVTINVRRKSRKSGYFLNVAGRTKHTWENNVSLDLIYYEHLHNEYKRSFVELHAKACDLVNHDPYLGGILRQSGIVCPLPPGPVNVSLTLTVPHFPFEFPLDKCMVEIIAKTEPAHDLIFKGKIYLHYKQTVTKN